MQNHINFLEINHFKSIKHLKIDCKRVNIFIGKPNVGKSNILEAMGLLGGTELEILLKTRSLVRYKTLNELFFDLNNTKDIHVASDKNSAVLRRIESNEPYYHYLTSPQSLSNLDPIKSYFLPITNLHKIFTQSDVSHYVFNEEGNGLNKFLELQIITTFYPFLKYDFHKTDKYNHLFLNYLNPPHGDNLFQVLHENSPLRKEITDLFLQEYGLQFVLTPSERIFEIIKNQSGLITKYPYSSIADTFQRYIFYLAAIESNNDAVLIFEEPEVHSFPPYTKELASRIANKTENQFFITTHSPYLLHTLIEELADQDLNVFLTYLDNFETKVKLLDQQAIRDIQDFSIDVFFNLDKFLHDA